MTCRSHIIGSSVVCCPAVGGHDGAVRRRSYWWNVTQYGERTVMAAGNGIRLLPQISARASTGCGPRYRMASSAWRSRPTRLPRVPSMRRSPTAACHCLPPSKASLGGFAVRCWSGSGRAAWLCARMPLATVDGDRPSGMYQRRRSVLRQVCALTEALWKMSYRGDAGKHAADTAVTPGDLGPRLRRTRGSSDTGANAGWQETNERKAAKGLSGPMLDLRESGSLRWWLADDLPRL